MKGCRFMLFTEAEVEFMRRIGVTFDFDNMSDDEYCDLIDTIGDYLTLECLDKDYEPNEEGRMCEDILAKLAQ